MSRQHHQSHHDQNHRRKRHHQQSDQNEGHNRITNDPNYHFLSPSKHWYKCIDL